MGINRAEVFEGNDPRGVMGGNRPMGYPDDSDSWHALGGAQCERTAGGSKKTLCDW
jgi:hypothetical protein